MRIPTPDLSGQLLNHARQVALLGLLGLHLASLKYTRARCTLEVIELSAGVVLATTETLSELNLDLAALRRDLLPGLRRFQVGLLLFFLVLRERDEKLHLSGRKRLRERSLDLVLQGRPLSRRRAQLCLGADEGSFETGDTLASLLLLALGPVALARLVRTVIENGLAPSLELLDLTHSLGDLLLKLGQTVLDLGVASSVGLVRSTPALDVAGSVNA